MIPPSACTGALQTFIVHCNFMHRRLVHVHYALKLHSPLHSARAVYAILSLTGSLCTYSVHCYCTKHVECKIAQVSSLAMDITSALTGAMLSWCSNSKCSYYYRWFICALLLVRSTWFSKIKHLKAVHCAFGMHFVMEMRCAVHCHRALGKQKVYRNHSALHNLSSVGYVLNTCGLFHNCKVQSKLTPAISYQAKQI